MQVCTYQSQKFSVITFIGTHCSINTSDQSQCLKTQNRSHIHLSPWILDAGYGVDVIYLNYKKAFDTVSHAKLKEKLLYYGVTKKMLH